MTNSSGGVTLDVLLRALSSAFVELLVAPAGVEVGIGSVVLLDGDDLDRDEREPVVTADLCLLVGVGEQAAVGWLRRLAAVDPALRPRAVLAKAATGSRRLPQAAQDVGVALVAAHAQARTETLLGTVRGVLESLGRTEDGPRGLGADTDLFGLAHTVASLSGGMVSIEDERSHVLAYSASDEAADELRTLSILGREGPADYLRRLREWGVFDRLRRGDEVIEVPADEGLGLRRRLVTAIRPVSEPLGADGQPQRPVILGTIWVQEGRRPLAPDAESVLRGASAVAARLIARSLNAPSNEAMQIQRLLGARGGGVDVPSLAAALSIPTTGPAVVVGFSQVGPSRTGAAEMAGALRLHASAFARDSLVTTIGDRSYVLLPRASTPASVTSWARGVIERVHVHSGTALRAAVAAPVSSLDDVAAARIEVDRVLDGTTGTDVVTTLADSRTPVLLGEILDLVAAHPELRDPRVQALLDYDERHHASMRESVETYLVQFGDVRQAAAELLIHPNTLRYRIRRAEEILDIRLDDPAGRLLVEIQLLTRHRG
ncbi:MAG: hypothetical protein JWP61_1206 [Friedmanniella sp.]|nr:hypothetical protein [Friedmanniella sp.]